MICVLFLCTVIFYSPLYAESLPTVWAHHRAIQTAKSGHVESGIASLKQLRQQSKTPGIFSHNIGQLFTQANLQPDAIAAYQAAISTLPDGPKKATAYYHLGNIYAKTNQLNDAKDAYIHALIQDPSLQHARQNLTWVFHQPPPPPSSPTASPRPSTPKTNPDTQRLLSVIEKKDAENQRRRHLQPLLTPPTPIDKDW